MRGRDREWRLSASPVLTPRPEPGLRSRRLARIAACHHIPRAQHRVRSLDKMTSSEVRSEVRDKMTSSEVTVTASGVTEEDSGQDTLTEGSDNQSELVIAEISQSDQRQDEDTSGPVSFIFPNWNEENEDESPREDEVFDEPSSFIFPKQEQTETATFLFGQEDINSMKGEVKEDAKKDAKEDITKVVHCYVASRGQRERETDIYEVPPHFSLLSCDI